MRAEILLLPGDGVGPEVLSAARSVLDRVADLFGHELGYREGLIGGIAIDETGQPLPAETLVKGRAADAILLGAVGGPKWSDPNAPVRPEQGLLNLRRELGLFANLRPVPVFQALRGLAPLREELLVDADLLIVRELTGGLYFGTREEQHEGEPGRAFDTLEYSVAEVERVAHVAFRAARRRRSRVASVDKANVLASMRLWRRTVDDVAREYPDVELEHVLVDACAMFLMARPATFDVLLTGNLFGDVLSDEASVLAGSLGMLPSASLGAGRAGLYEPVHGSAPDIAGTGAANPIGAVLSAAMLLRHSLGLETEAATIERAVDRALTKGLRTADIARDDPSAAIGTAAATEAILGALVVS